VFAKLCKEERQEPQEAIQLHRILEWGEAETMLGSGLWRRNLSKVRRLNQELWQSWLATLKWVGDLFLQQVIYLTGEQVQTHLRPELKTCDMIWLINVFNIVSQASDVILISIAISAHAVTNGIQS
jgi:hypothetical protein